MDSDKLSLPKRSAGEKNPIPPPKQLKLDDLTMWKKLPYDNKYPLHKRPEKDVEFFTSDLGKSLYERYPGKKFELTSDKKTSIPFPTYISLHDPYLRTYFEALPSYKNLIDKGLLTPDGKVKVHISEFNRYRMYLHHIWIMHVNHLRNNHQIEEQKRLQCLLNAVEKEDSLCKKIVEKKENINADIVMKDLAAELEQINDVEMPEYEKNPLVQSLFNWHSYQKKLQKDYEEDYPIIRQWLTDQTKNYKNRMEMKISQRNRRDNSKRSRWEKLRESSRNCYNRVMRLQEKEAERRRVLVEERHNHYKKMWNRNQDSSSMTKKEILRDMAESESLPLGLFERSRYPYDAASFTTEDDYNHRITSTPDRVIQWKESQEPLEHFPPSSHQIPSSYDLSGPYTAISERFDRISETASSVIKSIKTKLVFSDMRTKPKKVIDRFQTDEVSRSSQQLSSTDNDFLDRSLEKSKGKKKSMKSSGQLKKRYMNKGKLTDKKSSSSFDIQKKKKSSGIKRKHYQLNERNSAKVSKRQESDDPQAIKTPKRYSSLDSDDSSMLHKYLYGLPKDPEDVKVVCSTMSKKQQTKDADNSSNEDKIKAITVPGTEVSVDDVHHTETEIAEDSRKAVIRPDQQFKDSDETPRKEMELKSALSHEKVDDFEKRSADSEKRKEKTAESKKGKKAQIKPRKLEKEFPQKETSASNWQMYSSSKEGEKSPLQSVSPQTETIFGTEESDVDRVKGKANLTGGKTNNKNRIQDSRKESVKCSSGGKIKESDKTIGKKEIKASTGKQTDLKEKGFESNQLKDVKKTKMDASRQMDKGKSLPIKKEPKILLKEKNISLNVQVSNEKFTEKDKLDLVLFDKEQTDSEISSSVIDEPQADVKNKVPSEITKDENKEKDRMPPEKTTDSGPRAKDADKLPPDFILADSKEVKSERPHSFIDDVKEDAISKIPTRRKQAKEINKKYLERQICEEIKGSDSDKTERKTKVTSFKTKTSDILKAKKINEKYPERQIGEEAKSKDFDETATQTRVETFKEKTPYRMQVKETKEKYPERQTGEMEGSDSDEIENKIKVTSFKKKTPDRMQVKETKDKYPEKQTGEVEGSEKQDETENKMKATAFKEKPPDIMQVKETKEKYPEKQTGEVDGSEKQDETKNKIKVTAFKKKTPDRMQVKEAKEKYPKRQTNEMEGSDSDEIESKIKVTAFKKKTPDRIQVKESKEKYPERQIDEEAKSTDFDETATQTKVTIFKKKTPDRMQVKETKEKYPEKQTGEVEGSEKQDETENKIKVTAFKKKTPDRMQVKETKEKYPERQTGEMEGSDSDEIESKIKVTAFKKKTPDKMQVKETNEKYPERQTGEMEGSDSDEIENKIKVTAFKKKTPDRMQVKETKDKYPEKQTGEVEGSEKQDETENKMKATAFKEKTPDIMQVKETKEKYPERQIDEEAKSTDFDETATQTKFTAFKKKTPDRMQVKEIKEKYPEKQTGEVEGSEKQDETENKIKVTAFKKKTPDRMQVKETKEKYPERQIGEEAKSTDFDETATQTKVTALREKTPDRTEVNETKEKYHERQIGEEVKNTDFDETATQTNDITSKKKTPAKLKAKEINEKNPEWKIGEEAKSTEFVETATQTKDTTSKNKTLDKLQVIRKESPPKISTKPDGKIKDFSKRDKLDELHNLETSHETKADRNTLNSISSDTKREMKAPSAKIYESEDSTSIDRAKKESENASERSIDKEHELNIWRPGTPRYFQEDVRSIPPKVTFFTNMTSVKTENPLKVLPLSTVQQVAPKSFKESSKYKVMRDLAFYEFSEQQIRVKRKEKLQNEFLDYLEKKKKEEQENGIVTDSTHFSERKIQSSPENLKRDVKTKILNEDLFSVRKPLRFVQGIKNSSPISQEKNTSVSKNQLSSDTTSLPKLSQIFKSAEKLKEEIRVKVKTNKDYFSSLKYPFSGIYIKSDRTCSIVDDYSKEQESQESDDSCGRRIPNDSPSHLKIKKDLSESFFLFQKHRLKRADPTSHEDTEIVLQTASSKKGEFQPKVLSFFKEVYNERKKKLDEEFHRYVMYGRNVIEDNSQIYDSLSIKMSSSDSRDFFKELYKERKRKLDKELIEFIENREDVTRSNKAVTFFKISEKKDDLFGSKITEGFTKELKERNSEENSSSSPVLPTRGLTGLPIPVKISEKSLDISLKDDTYPVDRISDIAEKTTIQDSDNEVGKVFSKGDKTIKQSTYKTSVGTYLQNEHYKRKTDLNTTKRKKSFDKQDDFIKTEATDRSNKEHLGKTIATDKFLQDSKQKGSVNIMPDKGRMSNLEQDGKLKTKIYETGKIKDSFEEPEITDGFIRGTETKMIAASPTHKIFQEDIYEDLEEIAEETKFEEDDSDFLKANIKDVMKINEKVDVKKPKEDFDRMKHSLTKNEKLMPSLVADKDSRQTLPQEVRKVTTDLETFYDDKKPEPCSKTKDETSLLRGISYSTAIAEGKTSKDFISESNEFSLPAPQSPDRSEINREKKCIYKIDGKKYLYFARISIPWDQKGRYSPSPKSVSTNDSTSSTLFPSRSSTTGNATDKRFEIFRVDNTCLAHADEVIDSSYLAEKTTIQDSDKFIENTDISVVDHSNKFERGFGFSTANLISHITKEARGLEYVCTITEPLIKLSENVYISPTETSFGKRVLNVTPEIKDRPLQDPLLEDMKNQLIDGLHKLLGSTFPALCDLKQAEEQQYSEFYGVCSPEVKKSVFHTQLESIMKTSTFEVSARENVLTTTRDFLFVWPTSVSIQDLEIEDENLEFVATNFHDIFPGAIFKSADNFQYQVCPAPEQINVPAHLSEDSSQEKLFLVSFVKDSKSKSKPEFCPLFLSDAHYSTNSRERWMHYPISSSGEKTDESSKDISVSYDSENRQKYHILKKTLPPPKSETDVPCSSFESEDMPHKILLPDAYYGTGSKNVTYIPYPVSSSDDDVFLKAKKLVVSDQTSTPLDISKAKQKYHTVKKTLPPSENVAFDMYCKNESQQKANNNPHQILLPDAYYGTSSESDFTPPAISLKVEQVNFKAKKSKISKLYDGKQKYHTLKKILPPPESEIGLFDPNFKEDTYHDIPHRISLPDAYYGTGREPLPSFIESSDDDLKRNKLEAMEKVTATPSPFEGRQKFHTLKKTLPPSSYSKFIATDIDSSLQYNDLSIPDAYFGTGSSFPSMLIDSEKDLASDKVQELDVSRRVSAVVTKWKDEQKYRTLIKTLPPLVQKPSITAADMDPKNIPLERSLNFKVDTKLSTLDATDYVPPCSSKVLELKRNDDINIHMTQYKFEQPEVPQPEGLDFDQDIADILHQLYSLFWESSDQGRESDRRTANLKIAPIQIIISEDFMNLLNSLSDGVSGATVRNRNENSRPISTIDPSFQNRVWDLTNVSQNFSVRVQAISMDPLILKISHPSNANTTVEMNLVEFLRYRSLQSIENRANEQLSVGVIDWPTPDESETPVRPCHGDILLRPHFTEDETKKVVDTEAFLRNFKGLESLRNIKHKECIKKTDSHLSQRIKEKVLDLDTLSLLPQGINAKALPEMLDIDIQQIQTKSSELEERYPSEIKKTQSESFKPESEKTVTASGSAEQEEASWLVIKTKINVQTLSSSTDDESEYEEEEDTQNEDLNITEIQPPEIHLELAVERAAESEEDDNTGEVITVVEDTSFPVPSTSFAKEHDIQDAKIPHHRRLSLSSILSVINDEIHRIEHFYASRPRFRRVKSEKKKLKMERKAEKAIFIKDSIQDETIVTAESDSEESD
ncbi:uncharacterized protein TNCT_321431 [Trichonephila clavata]|uniref:Uncharacterized protein n=1 Tax=Trichonephila clavata TaxID=2740835 RepID=A0A8X6F456_TRICU|nr:uncharacterized protein TNCT_321431 [Trichonephila clavata]